MANGDNTVTPRAVTDPVLLLHLDTGFTDATGRHVPTPTNASISTAQYKFGPGSCLVTPATGTNNNIAVTDNLADFNFTGDFTIDLWFQPTSFNFGMCPFMIGDNIILYSQPSVSTLAIYAGGNVITGTTSLSYNTWYHIAVTRASGVVRLFINGVQDGGNWSYSTTIASATQFLIGEAASGAQSCYGYIDEVRVLNGYAAWSANFTPPTSPYLPADPVSGITGTLAITQANQTLSAAGGVRVGGTLGITQANQTISAAGGPRVGGTLGITQAAQTLSAAGGPRVGGTLGITQAAQTISATGNVVLPGITGTLSITQANQTLSAAGRVTVGGTLTVTQANQTLAATGSVILVGNLTVTQAPQTLVAAGGAVIGGHLTVTQANETLSAAGTITVGGTLNITQANNTLVAAGGVTVRGTLSVNQAAQTISATGSVLSGIVGTLSITQANQTLSAAGNVPNVIGGSLHVTQAAQTLSATGTVFTGITGTLAITQANQTLSATGTVPIGAITGTLVLTQGSQTLSATGTAPGPGVEAMHTLSRGSLYVAGSIKTAAGPVSGLPHPGRPGTRNFVTDATVPFASGVGNIVTGGGSNKVPVYDDGANWRIG